MLKEFLKNYFASEGRLLGISITQEGMIECILFNAQNGSVENYIRRETVFNPVKKIVEDMGELSTTLYEMINELDVKPKTPVVLNLPNFYFGFTKVDMYTQTEDEIKENIISEVEQSYMFKQNKPLIDYCKLKCNWTQSAKAAFCAAQISVIEELKNILTDELELVPIAIENSYSSMFKSLQYFGVMNEQIQTGANWGAIFVKQNSYTIFSLTGDNLIDMTEDAVAIKTYEKNEVDYSVASVINSSLQEFNFESIVLVNNSPDCTAEELGKFLYETNPNLTVIENNGTKQSLPFKVSSKVALTDISKISLFVIGAALYEYKMDFILKFNLGKDVGDSEEAGDGFSIAGVPIELNETNCMKLLILVLLPFVIVFGLIYIGVTGLNNSVKEETAKLEQEAQDFKKEAERYKVVDEEIKFDPW